MKNAWTVAPRAWFEGLWLVARAPLLLAAVAITTFVAAVPFGVVLGVRLQTALAEQPPISRDYGDIDAEWWMEFRQHARGLEATFTPSIIGVAAAVSNLSAMADGELGPLALLAPVGLYGLAWAFLWGGVLHRFHRGGPAGPRAFLMAARRHVVPMLGISLAATAMLVALYFTVHAWLFGPVFDWLSAAANYERDAFLWRLALYAVFGSLMVAVSLVADFARISLVAGAARGARDAIVHGARVLRAGTGPAVLLYVLAGVSFLVLLALYAGAEHYGGTRLGGWRAVALGQAYILGRLALRLTLAASELRLFSYLAGRASPQAGT